MGEKYNGSDVLDLMQSAKRYNNYLASLCEELVKAKNTKIVDERQGKDIYVEFDRPTALQIDGETIKNVTKYEVHIK